MRFQARVKNKDGMIHTSIEDADSWADAVNRLIDCSQVEKVISVKNVNDIPPHEKLDRTYARSAWDRQTQGR
jgi:hypothetical protein